MKDTAYPIRKAYYTLISGLGYDVYDSKAPDNASYPFIILGSQTSQSENTKSSFDNRVTINIDVNYSFDDDFGGRKPLDLIVDAILTAVLSSPSETPISATGFNVYSTKKIIDFDFDPIVNDTQTIYRRVITIEHLIEQV
jgi:hypothetical protein